MGDQLFYCVSYYVTQYKLFYQLCCSQYSHEADFMQGILEKNGGKLAKSLHFTFRYLKEFLSVYSKKNDDYVDRIYSIGQTLKDTIDTSLYVSYWKVILRTKLYNRDDRELSIDM